MDKSLADVLRSGKSYYQKLQPRKTICKECPHSFEVRTKSCSVNDAEMFCLEEPHICHSKRDGLCRGVTEKMIMNDMKWRLSE